VTVLNSGRLPVTVAALNNDRPWDANAKGDPPAPVLAEFRHSLFRATDTVVTVNSRQARVAMDNSIVCGKGGLLHTVHTKPLEFAHHGLRMDVGKSVLDLGGPLIELDCRPFDLHPPLLETGVTSSLLMGPTARNGPAQIAWNSPVATETVSTAVRWTGRENWFFQRGDGLTVKTPAGPVITLVQTPDDWKLQTLGEETGWKTVPRIRPNRTPPEQRLPDDYTFSREIGIDLKAVAQPARRLPR